jgi:ribosomal protein L34E
MEPQRENKMPHWERAIQRHQKRSFFAKCGKPNLPLQTLPFEPAHQKQLKGHSRRPHENGSSLLGAQQKGGNFGVDMP